MAWFRRSAHPEDQLSAYVDGELDARARRAVETHVAGCEACSTQLRELQETKSLVRELPLAAPRRSFTLGPQYAAEYRPAPAPRMSFSFAPAVALTVLVALLFVDAANFSRGGGDDDAASTAASTADRQAQPEAAAGLAIESATPPEEPAAADAAVPDDGEAGGAAGGAPEALQPPSETPSPSEEPQIFSAPAAADEDAPAAEGGPADSSQVASPKDSTGGLSTLRILEIIAAIAFAASLIAVFLPRIAGRSER